MAQQTTNPLIQMMIPAYQKAWAIFADCTGIFDADDDKKAQKPERDPIIRTIQAYVAIDCLGGNGLPMRIMAPFFFGGVMDMPNAIKEKDGNFVLATADEYRLFAASDFRNLVAATSEERSVDYWRSKCTEKRAEVKKKIAETISGKILVPAKGLLGVDGNPVA